MTILLILAGVLLLVGVLTYPRWPAATVNLYRRRAAWVQHSIGVDGFDMVYFESGPKHAPVLLLLHGFGGDADNWVRFSPLLKQNFRIIAPDLPGFGRTGYLPAAHYTLDKQIARLRDFVETLKLDQFHLIGNSLGGYLAAAFAATYTRRVLSLALFNAAGVDMPHKTAFYQAALAGDNQLLIRQPKDFDRVLALVYHRKPWIPFYLRRAIIRKKLSVLAEQEAIFQELLGEHALLDRCLPSIVAPTLVLWGDDDRVMDISSVAVFKAGIAHADIAIVAGCGHLPMLEKPRETVNMYRDFLRRSGFQLPSPRAETP